MKPSVVAEGVIHIVIGNPHGAWVSILFTWPKSPNKSPTLVSLAGNHRIGAAESAANASSAQVNRSDLLTLVPQFARDRQAYLPIDPLLFRLQLP